MAHLHVKTPGGTTYSIDLDAINTSGGSVATNGWCHLNNGLLFQWGVPDESTTSADYRSFPITFNNIPYCVVLGNNLYSLPNAHAGVASWIFVYSKAKFVVGAANDYTPDPDLYKPSYIAIGP